MTYPHIILDRRVVNTRFSSQNPEILSFFEIQIQYFHVDIKNSFSMIKTTFKYIFILKVLNWVTDHSQTEKYVEIISAPHD